MRFGIDGYNLAIPRGTGVATYGASLAKVLVGMGHACEGVFGIDAGSRREAGHTRERLFFEAYAHGHLRPGKVVGRVRRSFMWNHFSRRLESVPLEIPGLANAGGRWPPFSALWTSPYLFELAWARFRYLRTFTTVSMRNPPAVMHWTYPVPVRMAGARNIYTFHDLVPLILPETTLDDKDLYRRLIDGCIAQGDHIATVSEASRNDILRMCDVTPDKVTNTYQSSPLPEGIDAAAPAADATWLKAEHGLDRHGYYLFFGASDPKKNIGRILEAYLASGSTRPLVVVASRDWGMDGADGGLAADGTINGRPVDPPIIRLHYLPRDHLFRLIRSARAVLFPSLYEGFGLPALEAIQLGTPVISSNLSSLPEVVGGGGLLVDPYSVDAIAQAIRTIDGDDALLARLSAAGLEQARNFTDSAFAARLRAMYAKLGLDA